VDNLDAPCMHLGKTDCNCSQKDKHLEASSIIAHHQLRRKVTQGNVHVKQVGTCLSGNAHAVPRTQKTWCGNICVVWCSGTVSMMSCIHSTVPKERRDSKRNQSGIGRRHAGLGWDPSTPWMVRNASVRPVPITHHQLQRCRHRVEQQQVLQHCGGGGARHQQLVPDLQAAEA
jgi:hypothetical protein